MEIQSAFNSGVQGFQTATEEANKAAANIVANTVNTDEINEETALETPGASTSGASSEKDIPDLNQSIVDLKVAEFQAKASTQVIKSADESLGTLLDVIA
ncbi:hypothetical protein A9Q74_12250 [Colwellia sp. 39_35_sub15_T18]|nr:hypothetical protein A9Q74_12250 [Colwellia sp. 39_35_sub15_T18]